MDKQLLKGDIVYLWEDNSEAEWHRKCCGCALKKSIPFFAKAIPQ